jgi:acetyl esterase/lipase
MKVAKLMKFGLGLTALSAITVFGAVACAPVTVLNTITPSSSFVKASNISYGPLERQSLDIYRAENPRANAPVLLFIHGGSWEDGSKNIYKFLAEGFTSEGFDVVVPNYRLYPEAVYPQMIEDTALSVAFTAKQFDGRPLVIMGHSAGAYNVLMTGLDKNYLAQAGGDLCQSVAGIVSLSGPTGIIPLSEEPFITIFPDRFTKEDAPLNNVTDISPPIFFGHGAEDKTVYPQNSERLAETIKARGGVANVEIYLDMDHTDAVRVLSRHFDGGSSLKDDIIKFATTLPKKGETGYCR